MLGASEVSLVALLTKDFLAPLAVAFLIASPIAYMLMQEWLADFALRIAIDGWVFLGVGAAAAGLVALTISFHTIRAALANPVESLRYE